MCGIYYYENRLTRFMEMKKLKAMQNSFYKTSHRGPDNSIFLNEKRRIIHTGVLGFIVWQLMV